MGELIIDSNIKVLEKVKNTNVMFSLPDYIKPCVSLVLDTSFSKGGSLYSRNEYCYMILTELRRIGIPKDKAEDKINSWNSLNITALPQSDIRSSIRSAYKDSKTYGCNSKLLEEFCKSLGGKQACHYYKQVPKKIRNYSEDDYINFGWQKALTSRECFILFYIIPFLERKRGFNPGSWLYVSCRELEEISGINKRYFSQEGKNILDKLAALDLIYYIPGKQHKWNKQAGRIRRVIPLPKCSQVKYQNVNTL